MHPVPDLIADYEKDGLPGGVEGEQHADFTGTRGHWPEFLHIMKATALDPVDQRPAQAGALLEKLVDGVRDSIGGDRVVEAKAEEPRFDIRMKKYLPAHLFSIILLVVMGEGLAGATNALEQAGHLNRIGIQAQAHRLSDLTSRWQAEGLSVIT